MFRFILLNKKASLMNQVYRQNICLNSCLGDIRLKNIYISIYICIIYNYTTLINSQPFSLTVMCDVRD